MFIPGTSPTGIGAVLEQNGYRVSCTSRCLSPAEGGYPQTPREALAAIWAVMQWHKYLLGSPFIMLTDHEELKFSYNLHTSLSKSSAITVQR